MLDGIASAVLAAVSQLLALPYPIVRLR